MPVKKKGKIDEGWELSTDKKGRLHCDSTFELEVGGTGTIKVKEKLTEIFELEVGGTGTIKVKEKLTEIFEADQETTVKGRKETVDGTVTETYNGRHELKVTSGGALREVAGGETENIKGGRTQKIEGALKQTVVGDQTLTHDGKITQTVAKGVKQTVATGGIDVTATAGNIDIKAPAGTLTVHGKAGISIKSEVCVEEVAPKKKSMIPDWFGHSWTKIHASVYSSNMSVIAYNIAAGMKIDNNMLKVDMSRGVVANNPAKFETIPQAVSFGAWAIKYYAVTLIG